MAVAKVNTGFLALFKYYVSLWEPGLFIINPAYHAISTAMMEEYRNWICQLLLLTPLSIPHGCRDWISNHQLPFRVVVIPVLGRLSLDVSSRDVMDPQPVPLCTVYNSLTIKWT